MYFWWYQACKRYREYVGLLFWSFKMKVYPYEIRINNITERDPCILIEQQDGQDSELCNSISLSLAQLPFFISNLQSFLDRAMPKAGK